MKRELTKDEVNGFERAINNQRTIKLGFLQEIQGLRIKHKFSGARMDFVGQKLLSDSMKGGAEYQEFVTEYVKHYELNRVVFVREEECKIDEKIRQLEFNCKRIDEIILEFEDRIKNGIEVKKK